MELLKSLKLTQNQRSNTNNPILQPRIKLAAGISELNVIGFVIKIKLIF